MNGVALGPNNANGTSGAGTARDDVLVIDSVDAGYGQTPVLHDVTITVPSGMLVALLGPNGAGKTTVMRVACGLLKVRAGKVWLAGSDVTGQPSWHRARGGLCLIPEGRGVFPSLTVRENLELQVPPWLKVTDLSKPLEIFPALVPRMKQVAGTLSGGEQQMLALARAVLAEPRVILLDEISMGLAPRLIEELFAALARLAEAGTAMLLVEQYVTRALELCNLAYILNKGQVVYSGRSDSLQRGTLLESYLGG